MKILHVITGLDGGGAEKMLARLIYAMPYDTHVIISLKNIGSVGQILKCSGYSVYCLNMSKNPSLFVFLSLWRIIRLNQPDVIQTWMYHGDLVGGVIGRLAGCKNVIWNIRNTAIPQRGVSLTGLIVKICSLLSYIIPNRIVCCSYSSKTWHINLGYCLKKMEVIPNGYDTIKWRRIDTKNGISADLIARIDGRFAVGMVGRYDPLKGCDVFVKTASILAEDKANKYVFIMVGRGLSQTNAEFVEIVENNQGNAEILLLDERNDIPQILSLLNIFCLPSRAEGFPNALAEAMLCEVPCVVTDVGDARIIIGDDNNVVPKDSPSALADKIKRVSALNEIDRKNIGVQGRERIVNNYSIDSVARRYSAIYSVGL